MASLKLDLRGAVFEYEDRGSGGPPFVFIHGWACDNTVWASQVEDLSRDHRCVSVNLRGRGGSSPTPPFDVITAADDVAGLVAALQLPPVLLVGHSLGGLIALLVNDRHADSVLGTVLGDSPLTAAGEGRLGSLSDRVRDGGAMDSVASVVESFFVDETPDDVRDHVRKMMLACPPDIAAGMLDESAVFAGRLDDMIRAADQKPLMALWPARPLGDPEHLREITMFIRQEPVAGAGHFFELERPEVTNALLRAFLDDVERDPRIASRR